MIDVGLVMSKANRCTPPVALRHGRGSHGKQKEGRVEGFHVAGYWGISQIRLIGRIGLIRVIGLIRRIGPIGVLFENEVSEVVVTCFCFPHIFIGKTNRERRVVMQI